MNTETSPELASQEYEEWLALLLYLDDDGESEFQYQLEF